MLQLKHDSATSIYIPEIRHDSTTVLFDDDDDDDDDNDDNYDNDDDDDDDDNDDVIIDYSLWKLTLNIVTIFWAQLPRKCQNTIP